MQATSLLYRTPHGCMALADIQTHQRLAQDSKIYIFIQSLYYNLSLSEDVMSNGY